MRMEQREWERCSATTTRIRRGRGDDDELLGAVRATMAQTLHVDDAVLASGSGAWRGSVTSCLPSRREWCELQPGWTIAEGCLWRTEEVKEGRMWATRDVNKCAGVDEDSGQIEVTIGLCWCIESSVTAVRRLGAIVRLRE